MVKSTYLKNGKPGAQELLFLTLGGCNEIGMNLYVYGHDGKWVIVDCGVSFGGDTNPGVDVIMADPDFIEQHREDLLGIILTHAHEDHLGAIPYLWEDLRCPIYATAFTAGFLKKKLQESSISNQVPIHIVAPDSEVSLGAFAFEFICLTHSIPEPNGLMIRTKAGNLFHTGDWKIDPDPVIGAAIDQERLSQFREEGIRAMLCDSTNVLSSGHSESEGTVAKGLEEVIAKINGKVAVGCFASNIARLHTIAKVAKKQGRKVALVGRSMWRMQENARENGYLSDIPPFLKEDEINRYPDHELLLVCTGSQGEPRAALMRIAHKDHPSVKLHEGDVVIFSSREIPGNEVAIGRLQNAFARLGVQIITAEDAPIHATGHPCRDELVQMYDWIRPEILVPIHGEARHLIAQAKLAKECQIPYQYVPENGQLIDLAGDKNATLIDEVFSGRLGLSGDDLLPMDHDSIRNRRKIAQEGCVFISFNRDKKRRIDGVPACSVVGLPELDFKAKHALNNRIYALTEGEGTDRKGASKKRNQRKSRNPVTENEQHLPLEERIRRETRRFFREYCGKRPIVVVHELN